MKFPQNLNDPTEYGQQLVLFFPKRVKIDRGTWQKPKVTRPSSGATEAAGRVIELGHVLWQPSLNTTEISLRTHHLI